MVILALETATRAGSVALLDGERVDAAVGDASRTHGERLPAEITALLAARERAIGDVDYLAVVSGPGSFTGLRVGLATVQGLALVSGRLVIPVPTLEALAVEWAVAHPGVASRVVACLDGARGEVFFATYETTPSDPMAVTAVTAPAVAAPADAARAMATHAAPRPMVITGDGAMKYAELFLKMTPEAVVDPGAGVLAAGAARLAARRPASAVEPHAVRPVYVRPPDPVLARQRAGLAPAPESA